MIAVCQILDEGTKMLSIALKVNTGLEKISLYSNEITQVGASYIGNALEVNKTLTSLRMSKL